MKLKTFISFAVVLLICGFFGLFLSGPGSSQTYQQDSRSPASAPAEASGGGYAFHGAATSRAF